MKLTNNWKWTDWLILLMLYFWGFRFIKENDIVINGIPVGVILGYIFIALAVLGSIRALYIIYKKIFVKL